jgi:hypothetical protein
MESPAERTAASQREAKSDSGTHCRRAARIKLLVNAIFLLCPADSIVYIACLFSMPCSQCKLAFSWKMAYSSPRRLTTDDITILWKLGLWFGFL